MSKKINIGFIIFNGRRYLAENSEQNILQGLVVGMLDAKFRKYLRSIFKYSAKENLRIPQENN